MPKLEFKPIADWSQFNFLGKRLFDFVNAKLNAATGLYIGDLVDNREIKLDIMPCSIIIFSEDNLTPVMWIDAMRQSSRLFDGTVLTDGIKGLTQKKDGFIIGNALFVNDAGVNYFYLAIGS